ncbi:MAG: IS4 family transposase [Cyclobacteriaceae bacterium]
MAKNSYLSGQPIICQLLSYVPKELVDSSVEEHQSDRYYKTMTTFKQLVFIFYGVVMRCKSLNNLCKNTLMLEDKLTYLGIGELPAVSTLSDANINRSSEVFATLYGNLYQYYKDTLMPTLCHFTEDLDEQKIFCFDSSTITLFVDIFKGAGRNTLTGKKKGGLKLHTKMPMTGFVPDLVHLTEAACNDKTFLGQLKVDKGGIYIFDKGYVNYQVWAEWTLLGVFYVTRLNENANYEVLEGKPNHVSQYADGGIVSDQRIQFSDGLEARLVVFKDHASGKVLQFVSNMFDHEAMTIVLLYKYRWNIEVLFKQLKQNFELCYFFSDSSEGIKTQIWIALIAQLIFSVIHRQIKEAERFSTLVNVASNNMTSYVGLVRFMKVGRLKPQDRDLEIIQLQLFGDEGEGNSEEDKEFYPDTS